MKKVVSLLLLVGVIAFAYGCRKDLFVSPPESLSGDYVGTYIYKFEGQAETNQPVTWRFTSTGYDMRYDEDRGSGREFCDNVGEYEYEGSAVNLTVIVENLNQDLCSPDQNPEGRFSVFRPIEGTNDDTLKLVQAIDDLTITIKLVPETE